MKTLLLAWLLIMSSQALAQINCVRNPSFEDYSMCPSGYDQIIFAKYWSAPDSNYTYPSPCFPEFLHICGTGAARVPDNFYFWQYPRTGAGMAQIQVFYDEVLQPAPFELRRDYLQGRLYKKLTAGRQYCITFWVCAEEGSSYAIKELSAYLDNGSIDTTQTCGQPQTRYTPQVTNTGGIITDTMHWTKIEGSFIANGSEQFITIGNFKDKAHTTYIYTPVDKRIYDSSSYGWYLIDDVSVIESNTVADAGPDTHVGRGDSVFIGRPNETGLECTWNVLGSAAIIGSGAGIFVKPSLTTSYVVTQTLCGVVTKDTVKVEVWAAGIGSINGQSQDYGIVPNPNSGQFELAQSVAADEQVTISVVNTVGQRVYDSEAFFKAGRARLNIPGLPAGIYYLALRTKEGYLWNMRLIKQ